MTTDLDTLDVLHGFVSEACGGLPVRAIWAHGSLGAGDYVPGRSDLDLVAVLAEPVTEDVEDAVRKLHTGLAHPLLRCSYLAPGELDDPELPHLTWAFEELFRRPVTPVTRRELHLKPRVLFGAEPTDLIANPSDEELRVFVRRDMKEYWLPALGPADRWREDEWVDTGVLAHARGRVTLTEGRMITKREALTLLHGMGAPPELVEDIRARRYGNGQVRTDPEWYAERATLARRFLWQAITGVLTAEEGAD